MERLTSNKPVEEMSMVELAYNSCYAENRKAMYRDFETVRDARDFARELYEAYVNEELPTDDDEFDSIMIDDLQYEPTIHANGLIALFYRNLWAMADLREKLKYYEDAEEQGLLLRLPYPLETKVLYFADRDGNDVYKLDATSLYVSKEEGKIVYEYDCFRFYLEHFGKTVFLTKEEAEQALVDMKGE